MNEITYNYMRCSGSQPALSHQIARKAGIVVSEKPIQLSNVPLFSGLTEKQRDWLRGRLYARTFPPGKDVIVAGAPGEVIYIILSGTVKVYVPQTDGTDVIVDILGQGDTVGELSLVDQAGRSASVITLEESQVLWMNQSDFQEALLYMPVMAQNLLRILSNRVRSSNSHIQALAALDVQQRLARQLLSFASRYGRPEPGGGVTIPIRLTQNDLSELVGASRKRVNQVMVVLKRAGWIAIDNAYHITILNHAALEKCLN